MTYPRTTLVLILLATFMFTAPAGAAAPSALPAAGAHSELTRSVPAAASPALLHPPLPFPLQVAAPFIAPAHTYGAGHRGVDLRAAPDAAVRAVADGKVVYASFLVNRGVVSIEHAAGFRSTYEPVTAAVHVGQLVTAGTVIGTVDPGHCPPGVCLHWGIRLPDRIYLDPLALLRPWQVRLKPWG